METKETRWSGSRVQNWVQVQVPDCHLAIMIIPEGNPRCWLKNQLPSTWSHILAQLWQIRTLLGWAARTNTGCFSLLQLICAATSFNPLILTWLSLPSRRQGCQPGCWLGCALGQSAAIFANDYKTKKTLKLDINLKALLYLIDLFIPNFQYKKWYLSQS